MTGEVKLSDEILAAIRANRKIKAIKLLREEQNIGLKEAKDVVDKYVAGNPQISENRSRSDFRMAPLLFAAAVTAAIYFAYRVFS